MTFPLPSPLVPSDASALAQMLAEACRLRQTCVFGAHDARLFPDARYVDVSRLKALGRYREADRVITVETGLLWGELRAMVQAHGHDLALAYPPETPLSDILAEDRPALATGLSAGYPHEVVLGVEIATPDGQRTRAGGEVVKNVTGYDLNKLYLGAGHALGVLTAVTLRLRARPERSSYLRVDLRHLAADAPASLLPRAVALQRTLRLLSETTLATPLCACELFQPHAATEPAWQLLIGTEGPAALVETTLSQLHEALAPMGLPVSEGHESTSPVDVFPSLPDPAASALSLELAVPLGANEAMAECLADAWQTLAAVGAPPRLQGREAAGLFYLCWEEANLPEPMALQATGDAVLAGARRRGGNGRLVRVAPGFLPLAVRWNLPHDPALRALSARLKHACDPASTLMSSMLPLHALGPTGDVLS